SAEAQPQFRSTNSGMPIVQRSESVGTVCARVFIIANTSAGLIQQAHDGRQNLGFRHTREFQVSCDTPSDARQNLSEQQHAVKLNSISSLAIARMIPVLLTAFGIAPDCLQMSVWLRANPNLRPSRR